MLKYFLLSLVVLAVTAKPHRKPPSWHSQSQNNLGHGQNYHGHGNDNHGHGNNYQGHGNSYHGHGNNYHGHGNNHNSSNTHPQSGSVHQFINVNSDGCGQPQIKPSIPFIVGGTQANRNSWPWMVSLNYRGSHICGGSLITNQHVITAAHCIISSIERRYSVVLGKHDLSTTEPTQKTVSVSSISVHGSYDGNVNNDIAIMKLSASVELTDEISTVCIASKEVPTGTNFMTTGWGNTQDPAVSSDILNQVNVPKYDSGRCFSAYGSGFVESNMVCAGYSEGGKDSCQGDSGGPLVHLDGDKWYLSGITSWGRGCAEAGYPGVYTRADTYLNWIKNAVSTM